MFHPWRALRDLPHIDLFWQESDVELGHSTFEPPCITITSGMTQAERRSTLTHELIHHERGSVPAINENAEERIVDDLAARRLIPLDVLLDKMVYCYDEHELAEVLWVDVPTVVTRLRNLTRAESEYLNDELYRRELMNP